MLQAFCAGGDVKTVVLQLRDGNDGDPLRFFQVEYTNNLAIATLPIPYIALIDGIVMGGGVGVSIHGHFRVATERCAERGWRGRAERFCMHSPNIRGRHRHSAACHSGG